MTVTVTKYFSYHQKYMLRKHDWLVKALKLDNESLITSSAAARINGYVGGYGDEVRKNVMQSGPTKCCYASSKHPKP